MMKRSQSNYKSTTQLSTRPPLQTVKSHYDVPASGFNSSIAKSQENIITNIVNNQVVEQKLPTLATSNSRKILKRQKKQDGQLGMIIQNKVIGYTKHQVKPFVPTTKVFIQNSNPRFSYQGNSARRPITASINLNSARSEANLQGPSPQPKPRKLNRYSTESTLAAQRQYSTTPSTMAAVPTNQNVVNFNQAAAKVGLGNKMRPISKTSNSKRRKTAQINNNAASSERNKMKKVQSQFAKNMFNPITMNRNLQLQQKIMHDKKVQKKLKIESNEYQKFTDRVLQDLHSKV